MARTGGTSSIPITSVVLIAGSRGPWPNFRSRFTTVTVPSRSRMCRSGISWASSNSRARSSRCRSSSSDRLLFPRALRADHEFLDVLVTPRPLEVPQRARELLGHRELGRILQVAFRRDPAAVLGPARSPASGRAAPRGVGQDSRVWSSVGAARSIHRGSARCARYPAGEPRNRARPPWPETAPGRSLPPPASSAQCLRARRSARVTMNRSPHQTYGSRGQSIGRLMRAGYEMARLLAEKHHSWLRVASASGTGQDVQSSAALKGCPTCTTANTCSKCRTHVRTAIASCGAGLQPC